MTEGNMEFRKVPIDQNQRGLKRKLSMIQSFASALTSSCDTSKLMHVFTVLLITRKLTNQLNNFVC